ncbi:MAG: RNA polymerase sigma factor [Alphaproteobacteria bacterium]
MRGDRDAFEELVRRHQAGIRALSRRLARSASDGDDIAQAAFMTAWRRRSTWRGGSFRGWVCAIAYREFLHARSGEQNGEPDDNVHAPEESPGERFDLQRAFTVLDENERSAVALCLGAGLSHNEAALVMEAPLGSVKSWVARGRVKLQTALAAYVRT